MCLSLTILYFSVLFFFLIPFLSLGLGQQVFPSAGQLEEEEETTEEEGRGGADRAVCCAV